MAGRICLLVLMVEVCRGNGRSYREPRAHWLVFYYTGMAGRLDGSFERRPRLALWICMLSSVSFH